MVEDLIDISAENGIFVCSSNAANYRRDAFLKDVEKDFRKKGKAYQILEEYRLPEDFPVPPNSMTSDYLKVFVIQRKN